MVLAVDIATDEVHAPSSLVIDDGSVDTVGISVQIEGGVDGSAIVGHVAEINRLPGCGGDDKIVKVGFGVARDA